MYMNSPHKANSKWFARYVVVPILVAIVTSVISYSFGKKACNVQQISNTDNCGIIANGINWDITQNTIKPLSPLEIENGKIIEDNKAKITALFKYWNDREYDMARNTIYKDISWIFTPEKLISFREKLTEIVLIKDIEQEWEVINSDFLSSSKHTVLLTYGYKWLLYTEKWLILVQRSKKYSTQHHIKNIYCLEGGWPLCENFSQ